MELLFAIILFTLANILFMVHEHLKFNYAGSVFERWDNRLERPWWKNNSRPKLRERFPWLPLIWDGYHSTGWFMQACYWGMFGIAIYHDLQSILAVSYLGVWMALFGFLVHNVTYSWFFKKS